MHPLDGLIILLYFALVLGLGLWYQKRASRNLEAYFLGGKNIHWLALAMSGSVSNFDITGTMWIVSILSVLGMKSMWHHWMWGFLMGAFFLAYMGPWVRRSNVMTAAEWMTTRFGDGPGGRLARTTYALMAILTQAGFIGYAFQGIGKFASVYIPLEGLARATSLPWLQHLLTEHPEPLLAVLIIGLTTLYVVMGGLYSVVITDVIQTVVLTAGSLFIAYLAWRQLTPEALARLPQDWTSLRVPWRLEALQGTDNAQFVPFGLLVIAWVLKGLLLNAGGPGQMYDFQRFLAARDARDAARIGAAWSGFLAVRWAMAAAIVLLALTGTTGITDSEKIMPHILHQSLPLGVRGLVIAGLLAAFMSTFSSTLNSGASFIVRDLWQAYFKPHATDRQAVRFSYLATLALVVFGVAIGFQARSIAHIWNWLMMALGAGVIVPNVLRWYWWRINGVGYAAGMFTGIGLSVVVLFKPDLPDYSTFALVTVASLVGCVAGSLLTAPVQPAVLQSFYASVRPFGAWGPVRRQVRSEPCRTGPDSSIGRVLLNVALGMVAIAGLYLAPMYLVGHWYIYAALCLACTALAVLVLKFTWYDRL